MNNDSVHSKDPYQMEFEAATIKHLGLQMYSTLPPVIGELIANAWDASASKVEIIIPETPINQSTSEIIIKDDGIGMSDKDVRHKYLMIGRDRRDEENSDVTSSPIPDANPRKIMGRKGIGKFSAFGIAKEIVVESVKDGENSHFRMNYDKLIEEAKNRKIQFQPLSPTTKVSKGTQITLRYITKFKNRRISIDTIRRGIARRFAVIGAQNNFEVVINDVPISPEERNLQSLLDKDVNGDPYLWKYDDEEIKSETGWTVSGWIGTLERTSRAADKIDRGIVLMARGKLVQEPFVFNTVVGQQYALSYLIGELHVNFVDEEEDMIGTTRNTLVWDTEKNTALMKWGQKTVNKIARFWSDKRSQDKRHQLEQNVLYTEFKERAADTGNRRALKLADELVLRAIERSPIDDVQSVEPIIQNCLDFLEFDAFWEIAEELAETEIEDTETLLNLFKEWEIVEAKEMSKITQGRITTIEKFQNLIEKNALEKPTLHNFLKEFPWVIDPRWRLVDDEIYYSTLLAEHFPESDEVPESNKRIDFLCVREGTNLVVVEIKRPGAKVSKDELEQIEEYVAFIRDLIEKSTDPDNPYRDAIGYLLCGDRVDAYLVRQRIQNLAKSNIYIKRYEDLLTAVQRSHSEFLKRYNELREAKAQKQ